MGFLDNLGKLAEKGVYKAMDAMDEYEDSYDRSSRQYSNLSNEQLKKRAQRLKNSSSRMNAKRMGELRAMADEIDYRKNSR